LLQIIFGRLSVVFTNCNADNPSTTKTAPATINQCGYSTTKPPGVASPLRLQPEFAQTAGGFPSLYVKAL